MSNSEDPMNHSVDIIERLERIEKKLEEMTNILLAGCDAVCEKDSNGLWSCHFTPSSHASSEDEPEPHGI